MTALPYAPPNTLKPVADDIVDGPTIKFGPPLVSMTFPTRMTIIRLDDGDLFVHSPTLLTAELAREIDAIGSPHHLIGPNRLHYWWIPAWHTAFPQADIHLAPRIDEQAGGRVDFPWQPLAREAGQPWDGAIVTVAISGRYITEYAFFHVANRTLVLTAMIENFEPDRLGFFMRWLTRLGGVQHPNGSTPRDLRLTFRDHRRELRAAVARMIALDPVRIIIAHGRWYETDGAAELRRAFGWVWN